MRLLLLRRCCPKQSSCCCCGGGGGCGMPLQGDLGGDGNGRVWALPIVHARARAGAGRWQEMPSTTSRHCGKLGRRALTAEKAARGSGIPPEPGAGGGAPSAAGGGGRSDHSPARMSKRCTRLRWPRGGVHGRAAESVSKCTDASGRLNLSSMFLERPPNA